MNLYLLTRTDSGAHDYDTYDSLVVAAHDASCASQIRPYAEWGRAWADSADQVLVTFIGVAADEVLPGVVHSSFQAG